jgi:hypothetical protein
MACRQTDRQTWRPCAIILCYARSLALTRYIYLPTLRGVPRTVPYPVQDNLRQQVLEKFDETLVNSGVGYLADPD